MWILLGLIGVFMLPLLWIFLKDSLGMNSNKFYGDDLNKKHSADSKAQREARRMINNYNRTN
ncbi:hypothetical protein [Thalassobacillus hwangdonensis]|uniref:Uncharacterized protein n=1 Tax=Thalassobacillus hwangdonensis TaxID=546108 RepID=A0ABW3KYH3_9BACI